MSNLHITSTPQAADIRNRSALGATCTICSKNAAKYTCPRCNIQYCSVSCYKHHGRQCTDAFYAENVREQMQLASAEGVSEQVKAKTVDILKRSMETQQEEIDEELYEKKLEALQQFHDLALDEDTTSTGSQMQSGDTTDSDRIDHAWHSLPPEIRDDFQRSLTDGRMANWLTPWKPWWLAQQEKQQPHKQQEQEQEQEQSASSRVLIEEISTSSSALPETTSADTSVDETQDSQHKEQMINELRQQELIGTYVQSTLSDIPPLSSITRAVPSPILKFHLIDLLYTYCYVMRLYNGDALLRENVIDAAQTSCSLSAVCNSAGSAAVLNDIDSVVHALLQRSQQAAIFDSLDLSVNVFSDVAQLLQRKQSFLRALAELKYLFETAANSTSTPNTPQARKLAKTLSLLAKKLQFFIVWANEQPEDLFRALRVTVQLAFEQQQQMLTLRKQQTKPQQKPIVTEIVNSQK